MRSVIRQTSTTLHRTAQLSKHQSSATAGIAVSGTRRSSHEPHKQQKKLPASYYRGGTSRGVYFRKDDLPADPREWAPIFRGVIGSPDLNSRQLDGMGGGISSLSKVCVVKESERDDADVDFTFAAIGVKNDEVDFSSNCGNLTAAVGPFAVDTEIVPVAETDAETTVRIHNTNTGKIIHATFPVVGGEACAYGDFAIDGVAGTAARVKLDFMDPAGAKTGKLLPTGKIVDKFDGHGVTCIDVGNPAVFVLASEFGVSGAITPDEIENHPSLMSELDSLRRQAAIKMGVADTLEIVPGSIPKICLVSEPVSNTLGSGVYQDATEVDVMVRALSVGQPHKAIPITTALAVAAASQMPGSVVFECASRDLVDPSGLTIAHASGKLMVKATFEHDSGELKSASVFRTARRLMEGHIFWK